MDKETSGFVETFIQSYTIYCRPEKKLAEASAAPDLPVFEYDAQVKAALDRVEPLRKQLEELILGKTFPAWSCNCGAIQYGKAKAVEVYIMVRERFDFEESWRRYLEAARIVEPSAWAVKMEDARGSKYSVGLSRFPIAEKVEALFNETFKALDRKELLRQMCEREQENYKKQKHQQNMLYTIPHSRRYFLSSTNPQALLSCKEASAAIGESMKKMGL